MTLHERQLRVASGEQFKRKQTIAREVREQRALDQGSSLERAIAAIKAERAAAQERRLAAEKRATKAAIDSAKKYIELLRSEAQSKK